MPLKTEPVIVFAGYRDWALAILGRLEEAFPNNIVIHAKTPKSLAAVIEAMESDIVVLAGWSWILDDALVESNFVVGLHPSDLPDYAGGSPIQHQILGGVLDSKLSLYRVTPKLDQGPVLAKADLSLRGHMSEIFERMTDAGSDLLLGAVSDLDGFKHKASASQSSFGASETRKRLMPEMSRLEKAELGSLTVRYLFDFIRARETPYPNAFIEDETGTLYFRHVEFEPRG